MSRKYPFNFIFLYNYLPSGVASVQLTRLKKKQQKEIKSWLDGGGKKKRKRKGREEDGVQWQRKGCRLIETIDDAFFKKSPHHSRQDYVNMKRTRVIKKTDSQDFQMQLKGQESFAGRS